MDEQGLLFGGSEAVGDVEEELPQDVKDALEIVTGGTPAGLEAMLGTGKEETARDQFLKKTDPVEKITKMEDYQVKVFDLANPEHATEYARIQMEIRDVRNKLKGEETPVQIMLDPNTPIGYRVIVVLKYGRPTLELKRLQRTQI